MTSRIIRNDQDRRDVIKLIEGRKKFPFIVEVKTGTPRTVEQNKLQRMWCNEAEQQGDQTAEEYRAYSKAHFGIPILLRDNEEFREQYNRIIRPLPYELKLQLMMVPIDFPVTRLMTTKQKAEYLDKMYQHFTGLGMRLTEPMR